MKIDLKNFKKGDYQSKGLCPKTYSFYIGQFGLLRKVEHFFGKKYDRIEDLEFYKEGMTDVELRKGFREFFMMDPETREEIQNSFSIGPDGVYIVSNIALYKFRFNDETKKIEMDPKWSEDLPIYRQLRDRVVAMILEGVLGDGDALPSVRNVAAEYRLNPLTVLKGYQELVDEGEPLSIGCDYCGAEYSVEIAQLQGLLSAS